MATNTAIQKEYDLVVIGAGPGGLAAAFQGVKAGFKVVLVDNYDKPGGSCVHAGTLPSKSFRESVYRWALGSRGALGKEFSKLGRDEELPSIERLLRRRDRVIEEESKVIAEQLSRNNVERIIGFARFISKYEIEVTQAKGKSKIRGKKFIIATGASPVTPERFDYDKKLVHDSNSILTMKEMPKTLVVLGGGIIGCEYASMFSMAGSKVHLIDKRDQILASVDREIVKTLVERFQYQGAELLLGLEAVEIKKFSKSSGKKFPLEVVLTSGKKIQADAVLVALGRRGNSDGLGLDELGIITDDRGLIRVSETYQTKVSHIYAVGDVIGQPALASTSQEQGRKAACVALGLEKKASKGLFPYGIYTIPEISTIGQTEEELKAKNIPYVVGKSRYRELARGQIVGDQWGLLKMLVCPKTLKIFGVHIIGDNAADLIHIGQVVINLGGDLSYLSNNVFNYPTLAEAYKSAALRAHNLILGHTKNEKRN